MAKKKKVKLVTITQGRHAYSIDIVADGTPMQTYQEGTHATMREAVKEARQFMIDTGVMEALQLNSSKIEFWAKEIK